MRLRAEEGWDGPSLKRRVLASQEDRAFLRSIKDYMGPGLWKPEITLELRAYDAAG